MLELKGIKKDYLSGENTVHALKGVDLRFRQSEFVSILGQSGCGKTTLLNIIGGLDQYTSGDLIINGKSTKDFKDRDWDTYRNHSIGFVFQSYNLIPHQTVLQNVELALTLSGVKKGDRKQRAVKALEDVGLGNQLHKKPSEMSGGQMQRVAIARALVNDPDIILADEPTGALDTDTSVQVMEILKRISKNRLIVMVTHNPELAEQYSSRIIRMLDGEVKADSKPLTETEIKAEEKRIEKLNEEKTVKKKPSMSFATSFSLSLKNLFTKKGRTTLTAFAGSIGIIGIALVLSISQGLNTYIDEQQEAALSSLPLTVESQTIDLTSVMSTFLGVSTSEGEHDHDEVYEKQAMYSIADAMSNLETEENDLAAFKTYLEEQIADTDSELSSAVTGVQYSYDFDLLVYTESIDGTIIHSDASELMRTLFIEYLGGSSSDVSSLSSLSSSSLFSSSSVSVGVWEEMLPGDDGEIINPLIEKQYELVYGEWPTEYNEVVLVLDENNEISDLMLYALGLESKEDMEEIMHAVYDGDDLDDREVQSWTYEEICDRDYVVILNSECYSYDESTGTYTDLRDTDTGLKYLYDNGITLKITGIIRPDDDADASMLSGAIAYTSLLTEYIIEAQKNSDAVQAQLADETIDIFTGLSFADTELQSDSDKAETFKDYVTELSSEEQAVIYLQMMSIPSDEDLASMTEQAMAGLTREEMEQTLIAVMASQMGMDEVTISSYLVDMSDEDIESSYRSVVEEQVKASYAEQVQASLMQMTAQELLSGLESALESCDEETLANYYDQLLEFSDSTYETNLSTLGYVDLDNPSSISIYASTFESKDVIADAIDTYNEGVEEVYQITYTDYVGMIMSSITSIINSITYVLIAFVAISLIVSSIMIGVITLISVQERTKEIGILRAIGASKSDVSSMFNAETLIIGFASGLLGVLMTVLLCIPINIVIHAVTGIESLNAYLPFLAGIILVCISMALTLIAGIIPSRSASKKDPVVALRTE